MPVRHIESVDEWAALVGAAGAGVVAVDFTAAWCGPCRSIGPVFAALSADPAYAGRVEFVKVDVDELQGVAAACGVAAMPTFQLWAGGAKVAETVGANVAQLKALLSRGAALAGAATATAGAVTQRPHAQAPAQAHTRLPTPTPWNCETVPEELLELDL